jgi:glutamate dehydrogenase/leucine dehydrogenase
VTFPDLPISEAFALAGDARRIYFVWTEDRRLQPSHPGLGAVARALMDDPRDFDAHEAIFMERCVETGAVFGAFLHRTLRGQGAGGVRHHDYDSLEAYLRDGLRLARGMGRKNALSGLWWGGGKGIIARPPADRYEEPGFRARLYRAYGRFITSLRGAYVTAEDVGTRPEDMAEVFKTTRFTTCIPPSVGGSGNPSPWTARGVVVAMAAALEAATLGSLRGKTIAMQGIGNVGESMLDLLLEAGARKVIAADIDADTCSRIRETRDPARVEIRRVPRGDTSIVREPCDVLAPNALGGVLGPDTIPDIRAQVVCGAANNQLLDEARDGEALAARNIWYVPDFLANRMGIVNCANEQYGTLPDDPAVARHLGRDWKHSIHNTTHAVFDRARKSGITPVAAATALSDDLGREPHPIFGHRTRILIDSLVRDGWETA